MQKTIQRVLAVEYHFPEQSSREIVSEDCKDLMRRIFVANPTDRITMSEIQAHPWYQQNLPLGLATFNERQLAQQGQPSTASSLQTEDQIKAIVQEATMITPQYHVDSDSEDPYLRSGDPDVGVDGGDADSVDFDKWVSSACKLENWRSCCAWDKIQ